MRWEYVAGIHLIKAQTDIISFEGTEKFFSPGRHRISHIIHFTGEMFLGIAL
jgi:hypothetical protein